MRATGDRVVLLSPDTVFVPLPKGIKLVEIAPSHGLPDKVRHELCEASVRIAEEIGYDNAGTIGGAGVVVEKRL